MKNEIFSVLKRTLVVVVLSGIVFAAKSENGNSVGAKYIESARGASEIYASDESWIFNLINAERRKRRLSELIWSEELSRIAQNYSKSMARGNFFSHFDRSGADVGSRVRAARISGWRKAGENLFYCEGIEDFQNFAVKNWMKSAGHRRNILDKDWTQTGIGIALDKSKRIFITQIFIQR